MSGANHPYSSPRPTEQSAPGEWKHYIPFQLVVDRRAVWRACDEIFGAPDSTGCKYGVTARADDGMFIVTVYQEEPRDLLTELQRRGLARNSDYIPPLRRFY